MTKEIQRGTLNGKLLAGKSAENDDNYNSESPEKLRHGVVFSNDNVDLFFGSNMGKYIPLDDDHILQEENKNIYYPYYNETICVIESPTVDNISLETVYNDVNLEYTRIGNDVYIHSQISVTAYTNNFIVVNNEIYTILDSLFYTGHPNIEKDDFLGLDQVNNAVKVKNARTGQVRGVREQKIRNIVENDEYNGALKVTNPNMERFDPARKFSRVLKDE